MKFVDYGLYYFRRAHSFLAHHIADGTLLTALRLLAKSVCGGKRLGVLERSRSCDTGSVTALSSHIPFALTGSVRHEVANLGFVGVVLAAPAGAEDHEPTARTSGPTLHSDIPNETRWRWTASVGCRST
jgi:hypothetical protein